MEQNPGVEIQMSALGGDPGVKWQLLKHDGLSADPRIPVDRQM